MDDIGTSTSVRRVPLHGSQSEFQFEPKRTRMLRSGWCPHQTDYLAKMLDPEAFPHLARLHRLRFENHRQCLDQPCCIVYNTDMENYTTKHVTNDCTCSMVRVPYKKIIKMLRRGEVPLVSLYESGDGLGLQVSKRRSATQYIAISHVWADGLGNPRQNALPACQLKELQNHLIQTWHTKADLDGSDQMCPVSSIRKLCSYVAA